MVYTVSKETDEYTPSFNVQAGKCQNTVTQQEVPSNFLPDPKIWGLGTSLVVQWVRLCAPNAGGPGLIPGQGTRSHMHAATKSSHATTKEPVSRN